MDARTDTIVIGAGQAGLALGHYLARGQAEFMIVDAHLRVGDAWRTRWDSLRLFTPRRYSALPGMVFPGDPDGHPGKDEVADYLETYAARFELPVRTASAVTQVRPRRSGGFTVDTATGSWQARQVVVATGPFHTPAVPVAARDLDPAVSQIHSSAYRNPAQIDGRRILVAGGGNTGVQIADELSRHGGVVTLAAPELGPALPQRLLGRDVFWWFQRLGLMTVTAESRRGRRIQTRNTLIGTDMDDLLRRVRRVGRVVATDGDRVRFTDGETATFDAVVWATGFRPHYPWLGVPVLDDHGAPVHRHGITSWPGLSFLGLSWQRSRGSALLGWVGADAEDLCDRLIFGPRAVAGALP